MYKEVETLTSVVFSISAMPCNHHLSLIPGHFQPSKKKPYTHYQLVPMLASLIPWQPLIYFLSLWTCLFWTFTQHNVRKIIDAVARDSTPSLSRAGSRCITWITHICFIYTSWWIISTFWLLRIMLLWTFMYKFIYEHTFSVTCWTCWIILCLTFWRTAKLCPTMAASFHIPTSSIWASQILYIVTFFKL